MEPNFQPLSPQDKPEEETPVVDQPREQGSEHPYFNEEAFGAPDKPVAQPISFSGYTPASTVPDAFAPAPHDVPAENTSPITPLPSVQTVVSSTTQADSTIQTPVVTPPKKNNHLMLWVSLGATFLIIVGLVIGYFVVKGAADTSARNYTVSEKSYIDDTYDASTSPAATPSDILKNIEDIKPPVLESAVLSNVSGDYQAAEKLQTEAGVKVAELKKKIQGYAQVDEFYTDYQGLYASLQVLDSQGRAAVATKSRTLVATYLQEFFDKLKEADALIEDATLPSDLTSDIKELGRVHGLMSLNWDAMVRAYDISNSAAYSSAYDKYVAASKELSRAKQKVANYFNNLSSKSRDAAKELKDYRSTLN